MVKYETNNARKIKRYLDVSGEVVSGGVMAVRNRLKYWRKIYMKLLKTPYWGLLIRVAILRQFNTFL